MKKKLALLLAGLLVISFVGCGTPKDDPTQKDTNSTEMSETGEDSQNQPTESQKPETENSEDKQVDLSLKDVFAEHGMKVGTCLTPQMTSNVQMSKIILGQFNSVTMENAMKPDAILNQAKSVQEGNLVVEFKQDLVKMLNWAKENNLGVRGHTIVWHSQTPDWIFHEDFDMSKPLVSREVMLDRLDHYMKQVFEKLEEGGYSELVYAYDVANECWMEDGSMRQNNWKATIGDDYLWHAFNLANKYAPEHIDLYYNDYNEQFKEETFVEFVKTLVDENGNYLIDGIGLQAHLYTQDSLEEYFEAVDLLATTGLKLELTELDVSLGAWQNTLAATDDNLKAQGRFYYDLINGLFERVDAGKVKMDALTFWGFADGLSWRSDASPLLYNKIYVPKYSYYGAMQIKDKAGFDD